jgi:hypothetical protein
MENMGVLLCLDLAPACTAKHVNFEIKKLPTFWNMYEKDTVKSEIVHNFS